MRDQLYALGYEIENQELSLIALGGLPNSWESFVQGISVRSKIPKLDRLRLDCLQEESRLMIKGKHKMKMFKFLIQMLIRKERRKTTKGKKNFMEKDNPNRRKICPKFNASDVIYMNIMR